MAMLPPALRTPIVAACWVVIGSSTAARTAPTSTYIVQMAAPPAATYNGSISGYAATRPAAGARFMAGTAAVRAYVNLQQSQRNAVLASVGATPLHQYNYAFNGFSAQLTPAQVARLQTDARVLQVTPETQSFVTTSRTPAFLGLSTPGGLWSRTDALARNVKGEDVVIGMLDTGIWPEDPSFSDKVDASGHPVSSHLPGTLVYGPPPATWSGTCVTAAGFAPSRHCNNKLIGARYYVASFNASGNTLVAGEFTSPRDGDGHGSHTTSTAAGNQDAGAYNGTGLAGIISGMAPRARIATYKICWNYNESPTGQATCFGGDQVAAVDQAVADGVDVISFSIGGTQTNHLDPTQQAFLAATEAGVFVAAAAGNDGPGNQVAHPGPWLTTVAASTHDRQLRATVTLGNGATYTGASVQGGLSTRNLILSTQAALNPPFDDTNTNARLCIAGSLDPAQVAGKIVVCDRGTNDRVAKSLEVYNRGGVGMILLNASAAANDLVEDAHSVPTVHLAFADRAAVRTYGTTMGGTGQASFSAAANVPGIVAPVMASFSSRGPDLATQSVLKPDISAPGVNVLAAMDIGLSPADHDAVIAGTLVPPTGAGLLSGTSMATPHISGIAALLKQLHPGWSPAAIKSSLMTSTTAIKLSNGNPDPNRWGYGSGHVNPNGAADTDWVYDAGGADYNAFLCGLGQQRPGVTCSPATSIAAYNLNLASITGDVVGRTVFKRTLKNAGTAPASYSANASLPGFDVVVNPSTLSLAPGQSGVFDVTVTRVGAATNTWVFGSLTWSNGVKQVVSPLTGRASLMSIARQFNDTRNTGTKVISIGTGYDGTMSATPAGLVPATRSAGSVATGSEQCFPLAVPANTLHVRAALFNSETQGGAQSDLDLEVRRSTTVVGSSGSATSDELVDLPNLAAGAYNACVIGYAPMGGNATFTLSTWIVTAGAGGSGNFRAAAPSKTTLGGLASVGVGWSNLANATRYLGAVQFKDGAAITVGQTLVAIDTAGTSAADRGDTGRKAMRAEGGKLSSSR